MGPLTKSPVTMSRSGTVKFFNAEKGYGFITPNDGGEDVFVHQSVIKANGYRTLSEGESVEFDTTQDDRSGKTKCSIVTGPNGAPCPGDGGGRGGGGGGYGGGGGGYGGGGGGYGGGGGGRYGGGGGGW